MFQVTGIKIQDGCWYFFLYMISHNYTGLLKSCAFDINELLTIFSRNLNLNNNAVGMLSWLLDRIYDSRHKSKYCCSVEQTCDEFPGQIIQHSFKGRGYAFENGINYCRGMESDLDALLWVYLVNFHFDFSCVKIFNIWEKEKWKHEHEYWDRKFLSIEIDVLIQIMIINC